MEGILAAGLSYLEATTKNGHHKAKRYNNTREKPSVKIGEKCDTVIHLKMHIVSILLVRHDVWHQVVNNWLKLWFKTSHWNPNQLQGRNNGTTSVPTKLSPNKMIISVSRKGQESEQRILRYYRTKFLENIFQKKIATSLTMIIISTKLHCIP